MNHIEESCQLIFTLDPSHMILLERQCSAAFGIYCAKMHCRACMCLKTGKNLDYTVNIRQIAQIMPQALPTAGSSLVVMAQTEAPHYLTEFWFMKGLGIIVFAF